MNPFRKSQDESGQYESGKRNRLQYTFEESTGPAFPVPPQKINWDQGAGQNQLQQDSIAHQHEPAFRMKSGMNGAAPLALRKYSPLDITEALRTLTHRETVSKVLQTADLSPSQQALALHIATRINKQRSRSGFSVLVGLSKNPLLMGQVAKIALQFGKEEEFSAETGYKYSPSSLNLHMMGSIQDQVEEIKRYLVKQMVDIQKAKKLVASKSARYFVWAIALAEIGEYNKSDIITTADLIEESIENDGTGEEVLNNPKMVDESQKTLICSFVLGTRMSIRQVALLAVDPAYLSSWPIEIIQHARKMTETVPAYELFQAVSDHPIEQIGLDLAILVGASFPDKIRELVDDASRDPRGKALLARIMSFLIKHPDDHTARFLSELQQYLGDNLKPFLRYLEE